MSFLEDFIVSESLFIKYNYEPNGLSTYTIYVKNRKVFLRRQGEPTDYSWSAALYKLYSEVLPKSVHIILGMLVLYQLIRTHVLYTIKIKKKRKSKDEK